MVLIVAGNTWPESRGWFWTPALLMGGAACLFNAARCGRLHCYFTGPLYLLGAAATVLKSSGILSWPWSWIGVGLIVGTVLAFVPEWGIGKYVQLRTRRETRTQ